MTTNVSQKLVAVILSVLMLNASMFAVNHRQGNIVQDGVSIANIEMKATFPTAQQMFDLSSVTIQWADTAKANGTLQAVEAGILQNSEAFIAGQDSDVTTVYNGLVSNGYQGDKVTIQNAVNNTTVKQRKILVKEIQTKGLYGYTKSMAAKVHGFGVTIEHQGQFQVQPQDGNCELDTQMANDMFALAAVIAFTGQEEAALALGAVAAALYFWAEYMCPESSN